MKVMYMRVIAGKAKGRKLRAPAGSIVRPTSDKVKGAVFNVLAQLCPLDISFLDLFAGSGAMGIEAWSRGATRVAFVEKDRRAYQTLRANLQTVGYVDALIFFSEWQSALRNLHGELFDVVYADPPFAAGLYPIILESIVEYGVLKSSGILCIEHPSRLQLSYENDWSLLKPKRYGDTAVTFLTPGKSN